MKMKDGFEEISQENGRLPVTGPDSEREIFKPFLAFLYGLRHVRFLTNTSEIDGQWDAVEYVLNSDDDRV